MRRQLLISFLTLLSYALSAQNCLDTGEFDGPECNCTPPGWDGFNGAEEIDEIWQWLSSPPCFTNVPGESPTGGSAVSLHVLGGLSTEGIERVFTDLEPGQMYQIAFWFIGVEKECNGTTLITESDLLINIDGEEYLFGNESGWTLAEVCFVAESETVHISATGDYPGSQAHMLIDNAECEDLTLCCPLFVELIDEASGCPGQDILIDGSYTDEIGDVHIYWECDPVEGLDYLSDQTIINPVFNYSEINDSEMNLEFQFVMHISDDECSFMKEVIIEVGPNTESTFNFPLEFCNNDPAFTLPNQSLEGTTGSWNINQINFEEYTNQDVFLIFEPDDSNDNCPLPNEFTIEVGEHIVPTFDFPIVLCRSIEEFIFPTVSIEDLKGDWDLEELFFEDYSDGYLDITFFPDYYCGETVTIEIEIVTGDSLTFDLPQSYCLDNNTIVLDDQSQEGVNGIWDPPTISLDMPGEYENVFTPLDEDCYSQYVYTYTILDSVKASFGINTNLCKNDEVFVPDSLSLEGFIGYWQPNTIDPQLIAEDSIIITWHPDTDLYTCLDSVNQTIYIEQPEVLSPINLVDNFCYSDSAFDLNQIEFQQGVTGFWELAKIEIANLSPGIYAVEFTPDSPYCYSSFLYEFEILEGTDLQFSLPDTLCFNELPFALPQSDDSGAMGSWENDILESALIDNQWIAIEFTTEESCYLPYQHRIYIQDLLTPQFSIPDYICWDSPLIELPDISDNNVSGSWNIEILNPELITGNSVDLSFTPDSEQCADVISQPVSIVRNYDLELNVNNPMSCSSSDGSLTILNPNSQLEYSLDSGTSWTTTEKFMNLLAGNYSLLARLTSAPECIEVYDFELTLPDIPSVIESNINNSMYCDDSTGSIDLELDQSNVEFSIDNGQSWSTQNTFDNLNPGNYTILYRPIDRIDCEAEFNFEILAPTQTLIDEILLSPLSGCSTDDGSIIVEAQGLDLEYSIDGGQNWQTINLFDNLSEGQYDIIVRSSTQNNCDETASESILLPAELSIEEVETNNSTSCDQQAGSITILPIDDQWQYSIDNGQSWQDDNVFMELSAGQYQVQVRDREFQDCVDETTAEVSEQIEQLTLPEFEVMVPTDCEAEDAAILLFSSIDNVEYNIDGENDWLTEGIFENLSSGNYDINIRLVDNPECRNAVSIIIEDVDCECPDLNVEYSFTDFYCTDGGGELEVFNITGYADEVHEINWDNNTTGSLNQDPKIAWNHLTIVYDGGCEYSDSVFVEFIDPLSFILETFDPDCDESQKGSILITDVNGGEEPYNYALNPEVFQDSPQFFNLSEGDYLAYVLDDNGCLKFQDTSLENREAILNGIPQIEAIHIGETAILNPLINANSIDSFNWSPSEYILNPDHLVAEVQPLTTTEFTLTIYHGDCVEFRSVIVEVIESEILYISNIFDPTSINNNRFYIQGNPDLGIQIHELLIYDRWGNLVFINKDFEINHADQGWDGYYNNQKVNPGVFVYLIKYSLPGSAEMIAAGSITLVK